MDLRVKGFTLLEILVASVIGAFVAVVAVGSLRAITESREKIDANLAASSELRFAANMIQNDLHNLYRDKVSQNIKLLAEQEETRSGGTTVLTFYAVNRKKARFHLAEGDVWRDMNLAAGKVDVLPSDIE